MRKPTAAPSDQQQLPLERALKHSPLPLPTSVFRRRAWIDFQRALDPLAPPKPLRSHRH